MGNLTHSGFSALVPQQKSYRFGINLLFAIRTYHKIHRVCPPNFCITSVFYSSWLFELSEGKLKTILMQNFGGQTRCIMGGMHTVNWRRWFDQDGWIMALFLFCVLTDVEFYSVHKNANKKNFGQYPAILTSWLVSKAQFKHWNFYVLKLIPIIIQVKHSCSTVDSDVLRCTMVYMYIAYHGKYIVVIMH